MRKKPLVFEALVLKHRYTNGGEIKAVIGSGSSHLICLYPPECGVPAIPRTLLAGLEPDESHKVRITVERIDD